MLIKLFGNVKSKEVKILIWIHTAYRVTCNTAEDECDKNVVRDKSRVEVGKKEEKMKGNKVLGSQCSADSSAS